ncbi:MAG: ABC transporter substrate-binding protein [Eubacterium sp.]|nr:ABC transporter substrate-binding protein [Eubacterium sp.]
MKKKVFAGIMAVLLGMSLVACGSAGSSDSAGNAENTENAESSDNNQADSAEAATIRVGSIKALGTVTPYVSEELGYFEEAGINVEVTDFSDGTALAEAFAAGELDIGLFGIAPAATWFSKGVDMQVVAGANGGGHVVLVTKGEGIDSVADLKGKIIAEPGLGSVTDTLLRDHILKNAGLDAEKDVTSQPGMKPADMATSLYATGEVDAIISWEPFVTQAQQQYGDDVQILYDSALEIQAETGSDSFYPVNVVAASGDYIANHADILQKFVDSYKKTVDYINTDGKANELIAGILEQDEQTIADSRTRVDFNYNIDITGLDTTLEWALNCGYLDSIPDDAEFYNNSFVE